MKLRFRLDLALLQLFGTNLRQEHGIIMMFGPNYLTEAELPRLLAVEREAARRGK
jgi:hypothetical protein